MKISGFQNYKIANKVLASMLAVTITVGITPSFSFAGKNSVEMTALDDIQDVSKPQVIWQYKNSQENCIYVCLKDDVALDKILDKDGKERVTFKSGTTEVVARYELDKKEMENPDAEFMVKDTAGNTNTVKISGVSLDVSRAYKNENGNVIALDLRDTKNGISKVTYLDGREIEVELNDSTHDMNSYSIEAGTTAVKVYQRKEPTKFAVVMLELDWKAPEILRLYKNEANTRMIIKAMDNDSGIKEILLDGEEMTMTAYSKEIFEQLERSVTRVEIYDAVGHVTAVDVETDSTKPITRIEKIEKDENGNDVQNMYKLTMKAPKSGLWKVIKEGDTNVLAEYDKITDEHKEKYPLDEQVLTVTEATGIAKFKVYDAIGNVAIVDLRNIECVIVYAHNNADGSKIAVSLYDSREITKLAILNDVKKESVIEQFKEGTKRVRRWYDTPKHTTGIKVYYAQVEGQEAERQPAEFVLDKYEETPMIVNNKVYSLVGISKIKYKDENGNEIGNGVEFKENMPTRVEVDLTNCASAVVYDSLNNSVNLPE